MEYSINIGLSLVKNISNGRVQFVLEAIGKLVNMC